MTDHTNTYPDLASVEDWLNAKGYTGEAGACHQAMSLIRSQEKCIAELKAALKPFADIEPSTLYCDSDNEGYFLTLSEHIKGSIRGPDFHRRDLRAARAAYLRKKV